MKINTTNSGQLRQGDVLLVPIDKIPANAKLQKHKGRITVALGEATGHHHTIELSEKDAADWWKDDQGVQYVEVKTESPIVHQEHSELVLDPGAYKVVTQREYTPKEIRNVRD